MGILSDNTTGNLYFNHANLNDVAGDYHHQEDSTTDNRHNYDNTTIYNVSGSYNRAGNTSSPMSITVNGPFTQTVYFNDAGANNSAGSTRGSCKKHRIAVPNPSRAPLEKCQERPADSFTDDTVAGISDEMISSVFSNLGDTSGQKHVEVENGFVVVDVEDENAPAHLHTRTRFLNRMASLWPPIPKGMELLKKISGLSFLSRKDLQSE